MLRSLYTDMQFVVLKRELYILFIVYLLMIQDT